MILSNPEITLASLRNIVTVSYFESKLKIFSFKYINIWTLISFYFVV